MDVVAMSMSPVGIEDRLVHTVAVEENANVDGEESDEEGVVSPEWVGVQGLGSVRCLIYEDQSQRSPTQEMTEDLTTGTILFAISPPLPRDKLLRFATVDAGSGKTIRYYANGKITSPAGAYQRVRVRLGAIQ
jgi:hypothetical protein